MQNTANAVNEPGFRQDVHNGDLVAKYRYNMRSSGTTNPAPEVLFLFRGDAGSTAHRLQVLVDKANNRILLGQYDNGSYSTLGTGSSITTSFDTDYEIQIVADGRHVEVWHGAAGSDLAKIIEVETATVLSGPRYYFLVQQDSVVRVDDIAITTPDSDTSTYTYNNGNELLTMVKGGVTTTFTYDDWGRQVSKIIGANSAVYAYRFGSMLKDDTSTIPGEADLVQYSYDAFNKRREVIVTEASVVTSDLWYRYDQGFNAIARYDDGAGTWGVGTRNQSVTYVGMTPLAEVPGSNPGSGGYRYYTRDHLGSTRALYDGSKVVLGRITYMPYGEQSANVAGVKATYTYTGKPWEDNAGLYFFPYRAYSPSASRWSWRDPLDLIDGPNVYSYTGQNPIARVDRLGLAYDEYASCMEKCKQKVDINCAHLFLPQLVKACVFMGYRDCKSGCKKHLDDADDPKPAICDKDCGPRLQSGPNMPGQTCAMYNLTCWLNGKQPRTCFGPPDGYNVPDPESPGS